MTRLTALQAGFERAGFETNLIETEFGEGQTARGPLIVTMQSDYLDRERALLVEKLPTDEGDPFTLIHLRLVYPTVIENEETLAELLRAVFALNRTLPLGHNGFCEDTPAIYFGYTLTVRETDGPSDEELEEIARMIEFFTSWQGPLLDRIARGEIDSEDALADLKERGLILRPLFFGDQAA